ncbi:predicted protein [Histoplasma capsulatum H143]|uniref:Uncharacterized protein n=1 Tax=Ajellomyces capsulatus (strain H143) TaxID=544712 RepID=C6HQ93_AJECH|nr:predicted protein [Histoplasma capsulatum H143]
MAGRKGGWRYKPGTSCGNIGRGASVAASGGRANRGPRKRGVFWRAASGMRVLQRYCARGSAKFLVLLIGMFLGADGWMLRVSGINHDPSEQPHSSILNHASMANSGT